MFSTMNSDTCDALHDCTYRLQPPPPSIVNDVCSGLDMVFWLTAYAMYTVASIRSKKYKGVPPEALTYNILSEAYYGFIHVNPDASNFSYFMNSMWFLFDCVQYAVYTKYVLCPLFKTVFSNNVDKKKRTDALSILVYNVVIIFIMIGFLRAWSGGFGDMAEYNNNLTNILMSATFLYSLISDPSSATDSLAVVWPGFFKFAGTFFNSYGLPLICSNNTFLMFMLFPITYLDITYCVLSVVFFKLYSEDNGKSENSEGCKNLPNKDDCHDVTLA